MYLWLYFVLQLTHKECSRKITGVDFFSSLFCEIAIHCGRIKMNIDVFNSDLLKELTESNGEAQAPEPEPKSKEEVRKRRGSDHRDASTEKENAPADYTSEQIAAVKRYKLRCGHLSSLCNIMMVFFFLLFFQTKICLVVLLFMVMMPFL